MRKTKNLIIGISVIAAFFMALMGCDKAVGETTKEVSQTSIGDLSISEEDGRKETYFKETGELSIKSAKLVHPTATLEYESDSDLTMTASPANNAASVGLNASIFTVASNKCNATYNVRLLASDDTVRLYSDKTADNGNGAELMVKVEDGYSIISAAITFAQNANKAKVTAGDSSDAIDAVAGSYLVNDSKFTVKNVSTTTGTTISINKIVITYSLPTAAEAIEFGLTTSSSLSYGYFADYGYITDTLDNEFIGVSGTSYSDWSSKTGDSGIVYAGNTAGNAAQATPRVALRSSNSSGIITTSNDVNKVAKTITIRWMDLDGNNGKTIQIFGKETAYSATSELYSAGTKGTSIADFSYDDKDENYECSITTDTNYKYLGIRSSSGTLYIESINVVWGYVTPVSYDYSNVAIRFGNLMEQSLWTRLDNESTIKGYGVMLSTADYLSGDEIKEWYNDNSLAAVEEDELNSAIATVCGENVGAVKNFYTKITGEKTNPAEATTEQKGELEGDYYIWNLYKNISTSPDNRQTEYTAVAYIRVESGIVFLKETSASVKSLATDLISTGAYTNESFDGTLNDLATLA